MFRTILVTCVGNICRSPMAEAVLRDRLTRRGLTVEVGSAGIGALVGRPADPIAVALMKERGLDLSGHRARQITHDLAAAHELILVMEAAHQKSLEARFPTTRGRVHRLGRWGGFAVPDPFQGTRADFERALALIERGLGDMERALWG
jgi:protein-tyrosine phosphatase